MVATVGAIAVAPVDAMMAVAIGAIVVAAAGADVAHPSWKAVAACMNGDQDSDIPAGSAITWNNPALL